MAADLPARFTIENASEPGSTRYLATTRDGGLLWSGPAYRFNIFDSRTKADAFREHRMGAVGVRAVTVRYTVH